MKRTFLSKDINTLPLGVHAAGSGLYLRVSPSLRSWIFRYTFAGKRSTLALGNANFIKLQTARDYVFQLKKDLAHGRNPSDAFKEMMGFTEKPPVEDEGPLFKEIWRRAIDEIAQVKMWRNPKSHSQWLNTIRDYAVPFLGDIPVKKSAETRCYSYFDRSGGPKQIPQKRL